MIDRTYGRLGDAAQYTPLAPPGAPVDVLVMHSLGYEAALDGVGVRIPDHLMYVRAGDVAQPARGDVLVVAGTTYTVDSVDPYNQWEWVLNVRA